MFCFLFWTFTFAFKWHNIKIGRRLYFIWLWVLSCSDWTLWLYYLRQLISLQIMLKLRTDESIETINLPLLYFWNRSQKLNSNEVTNTSLTLNVLLKIFKSTIQLNLYIRTSHWKWHKIVTVSYVWEDAVIVRN